MKEDTTTTTPKTGKKALKTNLKNEQSWVEGAEVQTALSFLFLSLESHKEKLKAQHCSKH